MASALVPHARLISEQLKQLHVHAIELSSDFPLSVVQPLLDAGRLKSLRFRNVENGLLLPVHAVWLKSQPLKKGAAAFVELMG